jgi:hypothetical protein
MREASSIFVLEGGEEREGRKIMVRRKEMKERWLLENY